MSIISGISPLKHRLRLLTSYLRRSSVCPGLPITGIIATTHRCNMSCQMCIRRVRSFDGPDMDLNLFKKIIDEWVPYLRFLSLDGPGETTMYPDAFQMIRYAKSNGIRIVFSTNATLLDGGMADEIIDSGVDLITFSMNAVTPGLYKAIHGCDRYQEALENIYGFLARKIERHAPILVSLQMIRLPETLPQIGAFYRKWQQVPGVDFVRVKQDVVQNRNFQPKEARLSTKRRTPCSRLWHGPLYIETNGDVYASPGVLYKAGPIGNLRKESLAGIWNCKKIQAMRRAHLRKDLSVFHECARCAYPRPLLPLVLSGFLLDPFLAGKFIPLSEKLAFWHHFPLYEKDPRH
jgi:radical SAM protein with 4Fe4S-binding SPASM domain